MHAGLVGCDLAGVHELLDVGVVVRHAHQGAAAQQVDAGVSHVAHGHLVALDEHSGGGAAHAGLADAVLRAVDDGEVGGLDGGAQQGVVRGAGGVSANGVYGDGACDLAGGVAAHAVADRKERRAEKEGVLVVAADQAHVAAGAPGQVLV